MRSSSLRMVRCLHPDRAKLLQCNRMADWRQIQARIRKAKTSSDPAAQLAELYQRTRDAMVAFELAQWHEKAGNAGDTVEWYTTAAQKFRRAQWRTKAVEALTRLGAPVPEAAPEMPSGKSESTTAPVVSDSATNPAHIPYDPAVEEEVERERSHGPSEFANGESAGTFASAHSDEEAQDASVEESSNLSGTSAAGKSRDAAGDPAKRRRRGRRGGRN